MAARRTRWLRSYYGVENLPEVLNLLGKFFLSSFLLGIIRYKHHALSNIIVRCLQVMPFEVPTFDLYFATIFAGILSLGYLVALVNHIQTSLSLRFRMARKIVSRISNWSRVSLVLDVGCGRGILLNTVAMRLQKEGAGGRVVGVDTWQKGTAKGGLTMARTLKAASTEGVAHLVTCKLGDYRALPFTDNCFDVIVSALRLHTLKAVSSSNNVEAASAAERRRALAEMVRVVKPGGQIVIWDILHGQEYADYFQEAGLEVLELSSQLPAYLKRTYLVSARKCKGHPRGEEGQNRAS